MRTVRELTPVRGEPRDDAEQVTQLLPGEPLAVEETSGGWARIRTAYDYPGWIRVEALGGDPDPGWLAATVTDPLDHARTLLGAPYLWGGMTAAGIDCSGLVHMSFRAAGRLVPRDAHQQEAAGEPIAETELRPGDLITYGESGASADHVAFWLGDGRILHSTRRDGVDGVVEEHEPAELRERRRAAVRLVGWRPGEASDRDGASAASPTV
ncbi:MAG: C40 family peptidase [Thermoleophilia bacterium]|nr:C40 family peptidase [Thermoleophilia bacterium]